MTPPADPGESGAPAAAEGAAGPPSADAGVEAASGAPGAAAGEHEESEDEDEDEEVEALEDLILEAYNNMQIDGEYIFLPEEVAQKLHRVAAQMEQEGKSAEGNAALPEANSVDMASSAMAGPDNDSSGEEGPKEAALDPKEDREVPESQPEPELEQDQRLPATASPHQQEGEHTQEESAEAARVRKVRALEAKAAELRDEKHKLKQQKRLPRVRSSENLFTELPSVPEIDEEASSGPPSPSPPHSRSHSADNTPVLRPMLTPGRRGGSHFPAPPPISLNGIPSSAASPQQIAQSPASNTPSGSDSAAKAARASTYAKRREAARKLQEDKKKRALRIQEAARKQREDSKRQLEQAQQKDMEEKRERVRRIREERLHRRSGKGATPGKTAK